MVRAFLPPLPGVDPGAAPRLEDPGYGDWLAHVTFSPEGVDRMQIWELLHATPAERLAAMEALSREMEQLRRATAAARGE